MTVNNIASAARPVPEYLLRKSTFGLHDRAIIITFGTRRLTLLEPVVRGMPLMKDVMAAPYAITSPMNNDIISKSRTIRPLGPDAYHATLLWAVVPGGRGGI
jgi:hypothetical protein